MKPRFLHISQFDKVLDYATWRRSFLNEWTTSEQEKISALLSFIESLNNRQPSLKLFIVDVEMVVVHIDKEPDPPVTGVFCPYEERRASGGEIYLPAILPKDVLLEVLVHEFSHYIQDCDPRYNSNITKEYAELYIKYTPSPDKFSEGDITDSEDDIEEAFKRILRHEMDCNSRAFKLIEELELPLSHSIFWKRANAYHLFHYEALKRKSWYRNDPARREEIVSTMFDRELPDAEFAYALYVSNPDIFSGCF